MLAEKGRCVGCGSCAAACRNNCIQMCVDEEGFRYPKIDEETCMHCNACVERCPALRMPETAEQAIAYAAKNKDESIRKASSSGGVFTALAENMLGKGGAVCAAKYRDDFSAVHDFAFTSADLACFRGAKYVQSDMESCFPQIEALLLQKRPVLFMGTPCQVSALSAYLGTEFPNLLLVDTICHGVPSPAVWQAYIMERRKTDAGGSEIQSINLRSKSSGWSKYSYSVEIQYKNGTRYSVPQDQDPFMKGFVQNLYLRPSCAACTFKGNARKSDITLGDFWGIWDLYPEFDDNKGTSLVILNSKKGTRIWEEVCGEFDSIAVELHDALRKNPSAVSAAQPCPKRDVFFAKMKSNGNVIKQIEKCIAAPQRKRIKDFSDWLLRRR